MRRWMISTVTPVQMVVEVVGKRGVSSQRVTYTGCLPPIPQSSMSSCPSIDSER